MTAAARRRDTNMAHQFYVHTSLHAVTLAAASALPGVNVLGALPRLVCPTLDNDVGILGIELDQPRPSTGPLSRDQRRA